MKTLILTLTSCLALNAWANTPAKTAVYSFQYKAPQMKAFQISRTATSRDEAFRLAAQDCYKKLTNGHYPGEEKGLQIIDICANPKI